MTKSVYLVLYDDVQLLDITGPAGVLELANRFSDNYYDIHYISANPNQVVIAGNHMSINTEPLPELDQLGMLIIPGAQLDILDRTFQDNILMKWLEDALAKTENKISVCSGAFFLAELGCLNHKTVTTHWAGVNELQKRYPKLKVTNDTLYQNEGDVWTSAGVLSGVDMMLAIVAKDLGSEIALKVAKMMVVHLIRSGGQSQYSVPMTFQSLSGDQGLISLVAWLETRLDQQTTVKDMADFTAMSVRKLHSRCQECFNMGPAQLFAEMRLENARTLLRDENIPIQEVAYHCGFSQTATFSRAFGQRFGIAPSRYRESFRSIE